MTKGIKRLRQAIKNQRDLGNGEFRLTYHDAEEIAAEIEEELAQLAWAKDVPAPVDADGEVVPLTTKVMYDEGGEECRIDGFRLSLDPSASSTWRAGYVVVGFDTGGYVKDLRLRRPDSWEKLEKDVSKAEDKGICGYFGFAMNRPCSAECPARDVHDSCAVTALHDVMRRAEALAERDAKGSTPQSSPHEAKKADHD